ncbi:ferredoxin family protein [Hyphomicrobium sp.]|uniref:DUF362 domain-containing protein n=1 Tax=Hyphomicrobium sp. TaxID=82 RepID=UPI0025BB2CE0|nr:ferredoxin family protein [Hyphomicrobium sp.]MCC7252146.1 4Fe-4S binding protein [Hyphomicrobium sp.]
MPHVVTENCKDCRFTDCVSHCPVECFHADAARLYINPDVCIDCSACVDACPVHAIYEVIDLPEEMSTWIAINAERSLVLPVIRARQQPLSTAATRRAALGF